MTQGEKDLLLKDLIARLDTNLVCSIYRTDDEGVGYRDEILHGYCKGDIWYEFYFREDCSIGIDNISKIKPYLFPLSSMTLEQKKELRKVGGYESREEDCGYHSETFYYNMVGHENVFFPDADDIDWLNKHHFDYRGLISMGLAIDATNLNIY